MISILHYPIMKELRNHREFRAYGVYRVLGFGYNKEYTILLIVLGPYKVMQDSYHQQYERQHHQPEGQPPKLWPLPAEK